MQMKEITSSIIKPLGWGSMPNMNRKCFLSCRWRRSAEAKISEIDQKPIIKSFQKENSPKRAFNDSLPLIIQALFDFTFLMSFPQKTFSMGQTCG